jgi:Zn-dependent protease with chaperone function
MDFFQHQAMARRRTGRLVLLFALAVLAIIAAVYLAIAVVMGLYEPTREGAPGTLWRPDLLAEVGLAVLAIVAVGSLLKTIQLSSGGEGVANSLGGRPLPPNTRVLAERILLNVVEEMAIAAGTPVPPVYLLDNESAINAFAAGTTPQNAVIGVTRGAIETLSRDQLQGVIGHEFSHILNGDMRLNLRLIGVLNGILLIATIGFFLMRTGASRVYFSSSSSNDDRRGGNPLPLLGFCLYVIGYIGVFFGHLIKSAVSRQREYLADASAVQFTRLPSGIAGALKKIGGLESGSQLQSTNAEEASHMFFGNGLAESFFQMLSTHPPLPERIHRIEPDFNGVFPPTQKVDHTPDELLDPNTLARRIASPESVHSQTEAAVQSFAAQPAAAVASIGAPGTQHLDYAANLVGSLPPTLAAELHDPLGAVAAIYALLLDADDTAIRQRQTEYLSQTADPWAFQETQRLAPYVAQLNAEARLPVVAMVLPALKRLSPRQLAAFHDDVEFLIGADNQVSLFEYAVHRMVRKRLVPRLEQRFARPATSSNLQSLLPACAGLLSTLAYAGGAPEQAEQAFQVAIERLLGQGANVKPLQREQCNLKVVDEALDQLAGAPMDIKKRLLEACATCIAADGRISVEEGELLRVIADALDCPMPPLVESPQ